MSAVQEPAFRNHHVSMSDGQMLGPAPSPPFLRSHPQQPQKLSRPVVLPLKVPKLPGKRLLSAADRRNHYQQTRRRRWPAACIFDDRMT